MRKIVAITALAVSAIGLAGCDWIFNNPYPTGPAPEAGCHFHPGSGPYDGYTTCNGHRI